MRAFAVDGSTTPCVNLDKGVEMAFGKSPEEKAAAKAVSDQRDAATAQAKLQADDAKRAAKAEAQFRASPVGQATTAKDQGQGFFEIQLSVGSSQRDSTIWGGNNIAVSKMRTRTHAGTIAAIEGVGWHLEHVGYIFMITGESSRDKFLASGQQTAVSGETVGIYLFRNGDQAGEHTAA
jgi:hypothetical protein